MVALMEFIEKVGGPGAINGALGVSATEINGWIANEQVPLQYHLPLWKIAVVHRIDWTPPGCDAFFLRSKVTGHADVPKNAVAVGSFK